MRAAYAALACCSWLLSCILASISAACRLTISICGSHNPHRGSAYGRHGYGPRPGALGWLWADCPAHAPGPMGSAALGLGPVGPWPFGGLWLLPIPCNSERWALPVPGGAPVRWPLVLCGGPFGGAWCSAMAGLVALGLISVGGRGFGNYGRAALGMNGAGALVGYGAPALGCCDGNGGL